MNSDHLEDIENRFEQYIDGYRSDGEMHPFFAVKIEHSQRVADEARTIAVDLGWEASECNCAEALGLLHDIGRFSQFEQYGTFSDANSIDHGEEGYRLAGSLGILSALDDAEASVILDGIRYHNRRAVPEELPKESLPCLKLIRDADKLDILRIVLDQVEKDGFRDLTDMLPRITLDLMPSARVISELKEKHNVGIENVSSVGDLLLLQLSWIYDFNYPPTYRHLLDRRIPQQLAAHIERSEELDQLVFGMLEYARTACSRMAAPGQSP